MDHDRSSSFLVVGLVVRTHRYHARTAFLRKGLQSLEATIVDGIMTDPSPWQYCRDRCALFGR
jgi:hypothetical protein